MAKQITPKQEEELAKILIKAFVRSPLLTRENEYTKHDARLFRQYVLDVARETETGGIVASSLVKQLTKEPLSNLIEALNKLRRSYNEFLAQKEIEGEGE
jgi:hypothetical protein